MQFNDSLFRVPGVLVQTIKILCDDAQQDVAAF